MRFRVWFAALAVTFATAGTNGQQGPVAELTSSQFKEAIRTEAPVAGEDILGVVIGSPPLAADARSLLVRLPNRAITTICVKVESRDGRYIAFDNSYRVPAHSGPGYVAIPITRVTPFGTQHQQYYASASVESLAILVHEGDCAQMENVFLPTFWGRTPPSAPDLTVTFAIQSGRSTIRMTLGEGNDKVSARCSLIREGQRTAFDTLCTASIPRTHSGPVPVHLQRCSFDDCADQPVQFVDP